MTPEDLQELREARELLESPGLAAKITNTLGEPIEKGFSYLPSNWQENLNTVVRTSLQKSLDTALTTINKEVSTDVLPADRTHKLLVGASGALGGAFGMAALAVELPISTTIMLRSIADIARSQGEDLSDLEVQLACLEVFALGGDSSADDAAESGYFAMRTALAKAVGDAAEYLATKAVAKESAPALVRLISEISARFGVNVSQKAAAQSIPVMGAAGGAVINTLFMDHFQNMARGHFTVRRLERKYEAQTVKEAYLLLE